MTSSNNPLGYLPFASPKLLLDNDHNYTAIDFQQNRFFGNLIAERIIRAQLQNRQEQNFYRHPTIAHRRFSAFLADVRDSATPHQI
jgi:hypothetical protein